MKYLINAKTSEIGSKFGKRPSLKDFHLGIDFRVYNRPVVAAMDGKVIEVTTNGIDRKGKLVPGTPDNHIYLDHGQKRVTRYRHLSKVKVRKGQKVKRGQVIGISGNTGYSTGAHLHFELRENGKPVNPISKIECRRIRQVPSQNILEVKAKELDLKQKEVLELEEKVEEEKQAVVAQKETEIKELSTSIQSVQQELLELLGSETSIGLVKEVESGLIGKWQSFIDRKFSGENQIAKIIRGFLKYDYAWVIVVIAAELLKFEALKFLPISSEAYATIQVALAFLVKHFSTTADKNGDGKIDLSDTTLKEVVKKHPEML